MDIYHYVGQDIGRSATGDLQTVETLLEGQQRLLRRLLTNPAQTLPSGVTTQADYIFHPTYGAGIGRWVGENVDLPKIRALVRNQVYQEWFVARNPLPVITVTEITGGVNCVIQYTDRRINQQTSLSFDVTQ